MTKNLFLGVQSWFGVSFCRLWLLLLLIHYTSSVSADVTRVVQGAKPIKATVLLPSQRETKLFLLNFDNNIIRNIHVLGFFSLWLKDTHGINFARKSKYLPCNILVLIYYMPRNMLKQSNTYLDFFNFHSLQFRSSP